LIVDDDSAAVNDNECSGSISAIRVLREPGQWNGIRQSLNSQSQEDCLAWIENSTLQDFSGDCIGTKRM
jgi:hypothetical protein